MQFLRNLLCYSLPFSVVVEVEKNEEKDRNGNCRKSSAQRRKNKRHHTQKEPKIDGKKFRRPKLQYTPGQKKREDKV